MAQSPVGIADQLERASAQLDRLIADVRLGRPGAQHFHDQEERAQRIASAVVAPFRGAGARPVNPPLSVEKLPNGSTRAAW